MSRLSKYDTDRVWKLWVSVGFNGCKSDFVNFVTKAKYDKLLREFKKLEEKLKEK